MSLEIFKASHPSDETLRQMGENCNGAVRLIPVLTEKPVCKEWLSLFVDVFFKREKRIQS